VAEALYASGHDVVALDTSEQRVDRISRHVSRAAVGDGREIETLEKIGAQDARGGVVSTGDNITASILAALALRDLGVPDIYAKVVSREHARIMEKIGVTETIFPERESGLRLATRLASTKILNYVRLGAGFSIQEMAVPTEWIGRSLRQLALPRRHRVSIIAVHDVLTDSMIPVPDPDAPLKDSDTLLVAGSEDDLERVSKVE
jgi:trk system potassium uptake protein